MRVRCGLLASKKACLGNGQDSNTHGGDIAAILMNLSGQLADSGIVGFIESMTVKPARQD
jgi:hypothetical protein